MLLVTQSSLLCRYPPEILENIALELVLLNPLSPPNDLFNLNLTCKQIRATLNDSPILSSRIFKAIFDLSAPSRRLGARCSRPRNLADQLQVNYRTLAEIRRGDVYSSNVELVFWQAFLMLLEDDGRNRAQLEAAGLERFAHRFICERLYEDSGSNLWPQDNTVNALALWLKSLMMTPETMVSEPPEERRKIVRLVNPYVMVAFRYTSAFLPIHHFNVPFDTADSILDGEDSIFTAHGPYPIYREIDVVARLCRFGCTFEIASPLITVAAKHLYFSYRALDPVPLPPRIDIGDLHRINLHQAARLYNPTIKPDGENDQPSLEWEHTWQILISCWDPYYSEPSRGPVYSFGALHGTWAGKMVVPTIESYLALSQISYMPEGFSESMMGASVQALFMDLREYHCISPNEPVPGTDSSSNAWMSGVTLSSSEDKLFVHNNATDFYHCYEIYEPGKRNLHDESTCTLCLERWEDQQLHLRSGTSSPCDDAVTYTEASTPFHTRGDNDISGSPPPWLLPDQLCQGVRDVILSGTNTQNQSAWGTWRDFGRVRPWDGLVVIVREPPVGLDHLGKLVFSGYLVGGKNIIGNWRRGGAPTYEGGFTMSKISPLAR